MFWFMIYNSFDATYLYQYTFILLYNLVFTSLPVIALGGKFFGLTYNGPISSMDCSFRPGPQRQGCVGLPAIVHPWYPWS